MKKFLTAVLTLFCMTAVAQNRTTVIVQAGYQGAKITEVENSEMHHGARAGIALDFAFVSSEALDLSLQSGLNYSMKGVLAKANIDNITFHLHYVDIPILFNTRLKMSDISNIFFNFGPYLGYGIQAKVRGTNERGNEETAKINLFKKNFDDGDSFFKPFDFGAQAGIGIEVRGMMFGIGGQYGLQDIVRENKGKAAKNISFYGSIGYRF